MFQEAMTRIASGKSDISETQITETFLAADMDEDGYLTYKEAKRAYKKLCKNTNRPIDAVRRWKDVILGHGPTRQGGGGEKSGEDSGRHDKEFLAIIAGALKGFTEDNEAFQH